MQHASHNVDILDNQGNIIGHKPRGQVDKINDRYNAIYIFLVTPEGRVVLTPILDRKDLPNIFVGQLGVPVATIRRTGETSDQAAHRAAARELFIDDAEVQFLGEAMMKIDEWDRLASVFFLVGDPPQTFSKTDIGELVTMTAKELDKQIKSAPDKFAPSLRAIWKSYKSRLPV